METSNLSVGFAAGVFLSCGAVLMLSQRETPAAITYPTAENQCGGPVACPLGTNTCVQNQDTSTINTSQTGTSRSGGGYCGTTANGAEQDCGVHSAASTNCP